MKTITIHAYYHQHDVYEIPLRAWESRLAEHDGNADAALQSFIDWGVDPINDEITDFHAEVEKKDS
jgi:hypothetical protein